MDPSSSSAAAPYASSPFLSDVEQHHTAYEPAYPDFNTPAPASPIPNNQNNSLPPTPFSASYAAHAGSYNGSPYGSDVSFSGQGNPNNAKEFADPSQANPSTLCERLDLVIVSFQNLLRLKYQHSTPSPPKACSSPPSPRRAQFCLHLLSRVCSSSLLGAFSVQVCSFSLTTLEVH